MELPQCHVLLPDLTFTLVLYTVYIITLSGRPGVNNVVRKTRGYPDDDLITKNKKGNECDGGHL